MMKSKLFAVVLAMLFLLTACGKNKLPESAVAGFQEASTKLSAAMEDKAAKLSISGNIGFDMMGTQMSFDITGNTVMDLSDQYKISSAMSASILGQDMEILSYCDGTNYYMSSMGQTYRIPMDQAVEDYIDNSTMQELFLFEEGMAGTNETVAATEDGGYDLAFDLSAESLQSIIDVLFNSPLNGGLSDFGAGFNITSCSISAHVDKDGVLQNETILLVFEMDLPIEGQTISVEANTEITLHVEEISDSLTVTPPKGLDLENAVNGTSDMLQLA